MSDHRGKLQWKCWIWISRKYYVSVPFECCYFLYYSCWVTSRVIIWVCFRVDSCVRCLWILDEVPLVKCKVGWHLPITRRVFIKRSMLLQCLYLWIFCYKFLPTIWIAIYWYGRHSMFFSVIVIIFMISPLNYNNDQQLCN